MDKTWVAKNCIFTSETTFSLLTFKDISGQASFSDLSFISNLLASAENSSLILLLKELIYKKFQNCDRKSVLGKEMSNWLHARIVIDYMQNSS